MNRAVDAASTDLNEARIWIHSEYGFALRIVKLDVFYEFLSHILVILYISELILNCMPRVGPPYFGVRWQVLSAHLVLPRMTEEVSRKCENEVPQ